MIELNSVRKTYNKASRNPVTAVNNVSVELPRTGMIALFGRSGCGKTTLLNLIGGLDRADSGGVLIDGKRITPFENDVRNRSIGFIFQNYYLAESLTVEENVASSLRLCGLTDEKAIEERVYSALSAVGIEKYRRRLPSNLSGGQQQRVAIARAIVKNPSIILADEPTGNLDEANTVMVMDLLKEISKNTLVLLVTHEAHLVDYYCDRVIEMSDGAIIGERTNDGTGEYVSKNKNEVYLGDMKKATGESDGIDFCFYSNEEDEKLSFSIISVGGVFYVRSETPGAKLKLLDSSAELTVHEGSYEEAVAIGREKNAEKLSDITSLPPLTEGKTGRMYKLSSGLKSAWRRNFDKKKKFRKVLIATMMLASIVFVFISANCMTLIKSIDDVKKNYTENLIYVPINNVNDKTLEKVKGESEIVFPSQSFRESMAYITFTFRGGYSSSAGSYHNYRNSIYTSAVLLPVSLSEDYRLICGRSESLKNNEIVISSAAADDILASSSLSFVKTYEDIIGLTVADSYFPVSGATVVGIVDNSQKEIYSTELIFCSYLYENRAATASSLAIPEKDGPEKGSVYVESSSKDGYPIGSTVLVNGEKYTVSGYFESDVYYFDDNVDDDMLVETDKDYYSYDGGEEKKVAVDVVYPSNKSDSYRVIMNDEDFCLCSVKRGESTFKAYTSYGAKTFYAIYPKDAETVKSLLISSGVPNEMIYDSELMYDFFYRSNQVGEEIANNVIFFAVICISIAMCMFFIMRSSITSDVKEIGIYRAIGVSRRNVIFKYFVESNLIFFLTEFIGFAATVGIILAAGNGSSAMDSFLYLPWYIVILLGAFLYGTSVLCGILPVALLTKKTPAAIIAKYDI